MLYDNDLYLLTGKFIIGILIFVRVLAFAVAAPFFKNAAIPSQVKVFLSLLIAVSITNEFWMEQPVIEFHLWYLALLVLKEFMVGIVIGFAANLVFYAATFAGGIVDIDMGYQASLLFDINSNTPTLVGTLKEMMVLMIFLYINGHHQIIEAVYASLRIVPITTFAITESTVALLVKFSTNVLIIGIKLAAPVIVALFCTNLALALLARVAPQTNIFILSFQLKVAVGLIMLAISIPLIVYVSKWALGSMQETTFELLMSINPGRVP